MDLQLATVDGDTCRIHAFVAEREDQLPMRTLKPRWSSIMSIRSQTSLVPVSAMRLLVKTGEKLYMSGTCGNGSRAPILYSGFRPY